MTSQPDLEKSTFSTMQDDVPARHSLMKREIPTGTPDSKMLLHMSIQQNPAAGPQSRQVPILRGSAAHPSPGDLLACWVLECQATPQLNSLLAASTQSLPPQKPHKSTPKLALHHKPPFSTTTNYNHPHLQTTINKSQQSMIMDTKQASGKHLQ